MTLEKAQNLLDLMKTATPRPWYKAESIVDGGGRIEYDKELGVFCTDKTRGTGVPGSYAVKFVSVCQPENEADAELIARMRNDMPEILEAITILKRGDCEKICDVMVGYQDLCKQTNREYWFDYNKVNAMRRVIKFLELIVGDDEIDGDGE